MISEKPLQWWIWSDQTNAWVTYHGMLPTDVLPLTEITGCSLNPLTRGHLFIRCLSSGKYDKWRGRHYHPLWSVKAS